MRENRDFVLDLINDLEGGYIFHPNDPGGPTKYGITQATLSKWRGHKVTVEDVKNLDKSEAYDILDREYLSGVRFDALPPGIDLAVADFGVNSGQKRASLFWQQIVGSHQDGIIGPRTIQATFEILERGHPASDLITSYCDNRMRFLKGLRTWRTFGKGWTRRVDTVHREALKLAREYGI